MINIIINNMKDNMNNNTINKNKTKEKIFISNRDIKGNNNKIIKMYMKIF